MTKRESLLRARGHDAAIEADSARAVLARGRGIFWAFALTAAVYLIAEHRAHALGALPFLIILACPLMHIFMHGGHGGHRGHGGHAGHGEPEDVSGNDSTTDSPRDWKEAS